MKWIIVLMGICSLLVLSSCNTCEGQVGNNPELYYYKAYRSNVSYGGYDPFDCKIGNHTLNKIKQDDRIKAQEKASKLEQERKECYEQGEDYGMSFDLIEDYNYSCDKIGYINDNFILSDERRDGGKVEGSYSGFLSGGSVKGQFYDWVNTEILATGKLVKTAKYHLDCDNTTLYWQIQTLCNGEVWDGHMCQVHDARRDTKKVTYYTESDFIMYYVDNCVV